MTIHYSIFKTRFGLCLVASTEKGIRNILFADSKKALLVDLKSRWKKVDFTEKSKMIHKKIEKYLKNTKTLSNIKLDLVGTVFQIKVWKELSYIKKGSVSTYKEIAEKIGGKRFSRAVGTAIGNNPIGYIIPCHRVLSSSGEIGGYRWGIERKKKMLAYEAENK